MGKINDKMRNSHPSTKIEANESFNTSHEAHNHRWFYVAENSFHTKAKFICHCGLAKWVNEIQEEEA